MFKTIAFVIAAGIALSTPALASDPAATAAAETSATLQQLRDKYESGQTSSTMSNYDGWLACTRVCWNVATDCEIAGLQGCKNNYTQCMDHCRAMYPGN